MLSLYCIAVSVGSLFFFGLPLASALLNETDERETVWLVAPFLGLSVIVLVLQNLAYLGVRIGSSAPGLWIVGLLGWIWLWKKTQLAWLARSVPWPALGAAGGVYLVHALGLLAAGARVYVGRAWHDQLNYTALAQFLTDHPFGLSYADIGSRPYLFIAESLKGDRIGQSAFQGFLAVSTMTDAKTVFESAILLCPLLVALAIYLLMCALGQTRKAATAAAVAAGVLPAIAMVHLESFLSQALAVPLILIWPWLVCQLFERTSWRSFMQAALVLAAGASVYTEFYVFFLGLAALVCTRAALARRRTSPFVVLGGLVLSGHLMNLGFTKPLVIMLKNRLMVPGFLGGIYPWAHRPEGITRLWLGDLTSRLHGAAGPVGFLSCVFLLGAYSGMVAALYRRRDDLSPTLLALMLAPWPAAPVIGYGYQFYKMLLSVSPLFPVGWALLFNYFADGRHWTFRLGRAVGLPALLICAVLSCGATAEMTLRSGVGRTQEQIGRGGAYKLASTGTGAVRYLLSGISGEDICIIWSDNLYNGDYINGWLSYFSRKNRVRMTNPRIGDHNLESWPGLNNGSLGTPDKGLTLAPSRRFFSQTGRLMWSVEPYALWWNLRSPDWIHLEKIENPSGVEDAGERESFWLGRDETVLRFLAGQAGTVTLSADFYPGPSLPGSPVRHIALSTGKGHQEQMTIGMERDLRLTLPVEAGRTEVRIRSLDHPVVLQRPSGDAGHLMLRVENLRIVGFEGTGRTKRS